MQQCNLQHMQDVQKKPCKALYVLYENKKGRAKFGRSPGVLTATDFTISLAGLEGYI